MIGAVEIYQALVRTALANGLDLTVEETVGAHFMDLHDPAVEIDQRVEHHRRATFQGGPPRDGEALIHAQCTVGESAGQLLMIAAQGVHTLCRCA